MEKQQIIQENNDNFNDQRIPDGYEKIICEEIIDQTQTTMTRRTIYEKSKSPSKNTKNNLKRPIKMFRSDSYEQLPSQKQVKDTVNNFKISFIQLGRLFQQLFGYIFKQILVLLTIICLIIKTTFKEFSKGFLISCAFINKKCLRKINGKDPFKRIKAMPKTNSSSNFYGKKMYTVILDLDGTMVVSKSKKFDNDCIECPVVFKSGSKQSYYIQKRPYLDEFLENVSQFCNIAVYTSSLQEYADAILDKIDNKKLLQKRFYRQHCIKHPQGYIKDLAVVEADESKIIMIDDNQHATQLNRDNTFIIPTFTGNTKDDEWFSHLRTIIENIRTSKIQDVRDMVCDIKLKYF